METTLDLLNQSLEGVFEQTLTSRTKDHQDRVQRLVGKIAAQSIDLRPTKVFHEKLDLSTFSVSREWQVVVFERDGHKYSTMFSKNNKGIQS